MTYDFAADASLPAGLGALMQHAANKRAAQGFVSPDGQTHKNAKARDLYDAGAGLLSQSYLAASFPRGEA